MDEIAALRSLITKTTGDEPDEHRHYYPDNSTQDAVSLLRNRSLFTPHTLVLLHGAEQIRKKDEIDTLADYLKSPSADATLVLISDQIKLDKRLDEAVPPASRKMFWELFENQKRSWLLSFFRKRGVEIDPDAVDLLLELVENNTRELRTEAEKLCVFVGTDGTVNVDSVETFIYHSRGENVFTLFNCIVRNDFEAALETLRTLLASGEAAPVQLVAGLAYQIRKLLGFRQLTENGSAPGDAFAKLGIRGKRIQADYARGAERFSTEDLKKHLHTLSEFDAAFRRFGTGMHEVLLDLLLYQMLFTSRTLVA
jgi:DNA polymerase-3 subunit delta